ncbi:hypothetical protein TcWFU_007698 [Taenia crassiceps]|uniref:Uncharacterized protein n=1 Tax=Taenia crassiceps TaxID=6207 RepID=A0ABR4QI46_9CEST
MGENMIDDTKPSKVKVCELDAILPGVFAVHRSSKQDDERHSPYQWGIIDKAVGGGSICGTGAWLDWRGQRPYLPSSQCSAVKEKIYAHAISHPLRQAQSLCVRCAEQSRATKGMGRHFKDVRYVLEPETYFLTAQY